MGIVETLIELTKGERSGKLLDFYKGYINGKTIAERIEAKSDTFSFFDNGQELLIYEDRKIKYSCNYTELYGKKHITEVWGEEGLVFHKNLL